MKKKAKYAGCRAEEQRVKNSRIKKRVVSEAKERTLGRTLSRSNGEESEMEQREGGKYTNISNMQVSFTRPTY